MELILIVLGLLACIPILQLTYALIGCLKALTCFLDARTAFLQKQKQ